MQLVLDRCPHCGIANPLLPQQLGTIPTADHMAANPRSWMLFCCQTCGGMVMVSEWMRGGVKESEMWPQGVQLSEAIPPRARQFLAQALSSLHAPAGAVMLTGCAVDAMLKSKELKTGSLYSRIDEAAKQHLITDEMARWAHQVRLEANDQRHADELAEMPDDADARRVIKFAQALAQFLFVLPAMVEQGLESVSESGPDVPVVRVSTGRAIGGSTNPGRS